MSDELLGPRFAEQADVHPEAAWIVSRVAQPRPLAAETLARIEERIVGDGQRVVVRRARVRWWAFASLGIAGAAGAATVAERFVVRALRPEVVEPEPGSGRARRARPPRTVPLIPRQALVPASEPSFPPEPEPVARAAQRRPPERQRSRLPAAAERPAPPVSTLAAETELLEVALQKLRQKRDGAGALVVLEQYRQRFPGGMMEHEADRTRVEALLLTERPRPALEVLDRMGIGSSARDLELAVVRGELRAEVGRCLEAEADFSAVLVGARSGVAVERALWGRASCRSRRNDDAGARTDLEQYLARFPTGRNAAQARRALGK